MTVEDFIYEAICRKWSDGDIHFALSMIGLEGPKVSILIEETRDRVLRGEPAQGSPSQFSKWLLDAFVCHWHSERQRLLEFLRIKHETPEMDIHGGVFSEKGEVKSTCAY